MAKQKKNMKKINRQNELKSKNDRSNLLPLILIIGAAVLFAAVVGVAAYFYAN